MKNDEIELNKKLNVTFNKTYLRKSEKTAGNEYLITLKNERNGKRVYFHFHDSRKNQSTLIDFVKSLEMDALAYENTYNLADFMNEYGYEDDKEGRLVYNACKKQSQRFNKLFNDREKEEIAKIEY